MKISISSTLVDAELACFIVDNELTDFLSIVGIKYMDLFLICRLDMDYYSIMMGAIGGGTLKLLNVG